MTPPNRQRQELPVVRLIGRDDQLCGSWKGRDFGAANFTRDMTWTSKLHPPHSMYMIYTIYYKYIYIYTCFHLHQLAADVCVEVPRLPRAWAAWFRSSRCWACKRRRDSEAYLADVGAVGWKTVCPSQRVSKPVCLMLLFVYIGRKFKLLNNIILIRILHIYDIL